MLLSRLLANFTRGESDTLRKAMGKKNEQLMFKLRERFIEGCMSNPEFVKECFQKEKKPEDLIDKIWKDWESFAQYAFNKSHSVCYAYVAYQTGYLKANYPAEFMAANLSRNLNHIMEITKFMQECKRMNLKVLGPDVNESIVKFTVNRKGEIRFGMAAIKGVGEGAVNEILTARQKGGFFRDIYDFAERVNLQTVNKKNLEAMAIAGVFDSFGNIYRNQFFAGDSENDPSGFIEKLIRYGNKIQSDSASLQQTLFGGAGNQQSIKKPAIPAVKEWPQLILLEKEKSLIGIYLTAHPLDDYRLEMDNFCTKGVTLKDINEQIEKYKDRELTFGGMVTDAGEGISKNGKPFSKLTLSDYSDSYQFFFFQQDFVDYGKFCKPGLFILLKGKVQKRYNSESLEFRVNHVELLSEVRKNQIKNFTINIPLSMVSESVIHEIEKLMKKNKGNTFLRFTITDEETNNTVLLFSRNTKILVSQDFFRFFEDHPEITYRIN
jgi:DNA polymerase III subunit alpha